MRPWLLESSAVQTLCKPPVTVRYWTVIICSSSRCCVLFPGLRHLLVTIGVSSPTSPLSSVTFLLPLPARAVEAQNLKFSSSCSSSSPPGFCISLSLQLSSDKCQAHLPDLFPRLITRQLYYALRRTQHTEIYFRFLWVLCRIYIGDDHLITPLKIVLAPPWWAQPLRGWVWPLHPIKYVFKTFAARSADRHIPYDTWKHISSVATRRDVVGQSSKKGCSFLSWSEVNAFWLRAELPSN